MNHRWFKSEKVSEKLPDFKNKHKVLEKMASLEKSSEALSYGSPKPSEKIREIIELFNVHENPSDFRHPENFVFVEN